MMMITMITIMILLNLIIIIMMNINILFQSVMMIKSLIANNDHPDSFGDFKDDCDYKSQKMTMIMNSLVTMTKMINLCYDNIDDKNDRRNSGGTLRQKLDLNDI